MTNHADSEDILTVQKKKWKSERIQIPQTNHTSQRHYDTRTLFQDQSSMELFGKTKKILKDRQHPIALQKKVMDQCVLPTMTYGRQTWSINKQLTNKLDTAQRAMESKMLGLKLQDKIPGSQIRKRTKIIDIIEYTLKKSGTGPNIQQERRSTGGPNAAQSGNQPRRGKRSRGQPSRRWQGRRKPPGTGKQQTEDNRRH